MITVDKEELRVDRAVNVSRKKINLLVAEFHLDLHTGRPITQSDYTRCCIHTIVPLRMST
jgi:hypothetical protein